MSHPPNRLLLWRNWLHIALLLCSLGGLAACGGGAQTASGVGSGGTGAVYGTVNGFGSVLVDGRRLDDSGALVQAESEPGNVNKAGQDDPVAKLGQQVELDTDADATAVSRIRLLPEVIGLVDSIDLAQQRLVVAGQSVRLTSAAAGGIATALEGLDGLDELAVGDRLEVHGHARRDASGGDFIAATRIERRLAGQTFTRVSGRIAALDNAARWLQVGSLRITYAPDVTRVPAGVALALGRRVVVWSDQAVSAGALPAQTIAVITRSLAGQSVRLGGPVADCTLACAASFSVAGQSVNASNAVFTAGVPGDLADGKLVRVAGKVDAASGVLLATSVSFKASDEDDVTLFGTVTDFVSDANALRVRGVAVVTDASTRLDAGCTLANGLAVSVQGKLHANKVQATRISCLATLEGNTLELRGVVTNLNALAQTLKIDGLLASLPVSFAKASVSGGALASLANGQYLELSGKVTNGVLVATRIEVATAPAHAQFETQGLVYGVLASQLRLNGLTIGFDPALLITGSGDGPLRTGQRLRVRFTSGQTGYRAVSIHRL